MIPLGAFQEAGGACSNTAAFTTPLRANVQYEEEVAYQMFGQETIARQKLMEQPPATARVKVPSAHGTRCSSESRAVSGRVYRGIMTRKISEVPFHSI